MTPQEFVQTYLLELRSTMAGAFARYAALKTEVGQIGQVVDRLKADMIAIDDTLDLVDRFGHQVPSYSLDLKKETH